MTGQCDDPTCILGYVYKPDQPRGERNQPCPTCRPQWTPPVLPALPTKINTLSGSRHNPRDSQPD